MIKKIIMAGVMGLSMMPVSADDYTLPFTFKASETTFGECVKIDGNGDGVEGTTNGVWSYNNGASIFLS